MCGTKQTSDEDTNRLDNDWVFWTTTIRPSAVTIPMQHEEEDDDGHH